MSYKEGDSKDKSYFGAKFAKRNECDVSTRFYGS